MRTRKRKIEKVTKEIERERKRKRRKYRETLRDEKR